MSFFDKFFKNAFGWLFPGDGSTNFLKPFKAISDVFSNAFGNNGDKGWLSDLFDSSGTEFSGLLSSLTNRITAEHMTGADREAAQLSYQQQEQFFNQYQSIPAQVRQSVEAGLNPALMYGRGATPMSPISGNASASSPSLDPVSMISGLVGLGFQAKELQANIALKGADANLKNAQADMTRRNISAFAERLERERGKYDLEQRIGNKNIDEIDAKIKVDYALESRYLQDINESEARQLVAEADAALKKVDLETRSAYNNACLSLVQSEQKLNQAQEELAFAEKYKTQSENSYMKIKVKNAQREYDDAHNQVVSAIDKIKSDKSLTDKEVEFFENKYNLQVVTAVNGAANVAKFTTQTRFGNAGYKYMSYIDDMGFVAKKVGHDLRQYYRP